MKIHLNILKFWYFTDFKLQLPHSSPYFAATTCTHNTCLFHPKYPKPFSQNNLVKGF